VHFRDDVAFGKHLQILFFLRENIRTCVIRSAPSLENALTLADGLCLLHVENCHNRRDDVGDVA
jgi:hypothetical protein